MPAEPILVDLLIQVDCGPCEDAKTVLAGLAAEFPLKLRMTDIGSSEGQQLAAGTGILFPPGILIDGQPFSYGRPSAKKLRRELERRCAPRPQQCPPLP